MKKWLRVLAIVATATASSSCAASADGPPEIIVDQTTCAHCGMFVSEPAFAAAYRADGETRIFDDIGCLIEAVQKEREPGRARFWFHDLQSAAWIAGETATFVRTTHLHTPMGGSLVAYRDRRQAHDAAKQSHGQVIGGLSELLAQNGGTR